MTRMAVTAPDRTIDNARLWDRLQRLARIGAVEAGGVDRPAYGAAHAEAVALVASWMREAGLEPGLDDAGTLVATLPGTEPGLASVALGSHLDTVPQGGAFDGALGVLAALEVVQTVAERGLRPKRPLTVIGFADEEGNSFGIGVLSAQLWTGDIGPERRAKIVDRAGRTLEGALAGFSVPGLPRVERPELSAYLELHVEQGPVLDRDGRPAAAVEAIVGISRTTVRFVGEANHAGTTPMALRKDALWGAAELALAVRDLTRASDDRAVGTVGVLEVRPGATNVVPGDALLRVEMRSPDESLMARLRERVEAEARAAAERHGLTVTLEPWHHSPAVPMHPVALAATQAALGDAGLPAFTMPSWAGHDAKVMARHVPTGMLFVPSRGGFSHCPQEDTTREQCARGVQALLHAALRLAERDEP
jgi:beta-ureidopropionase / N-carbamoyl-L-amino-acid hydrolase